MHCLYIRYSKRWSGQQVSFSPKLHVYMTGALGLARVSLTLPVCAVCSVCLQMFIWVSWSIWVLLWICRSPIGKTAIWTVLGPVSSDGYKRDCYFFFFFFSCTSLKDLTGQRGCQFFSAKCDITDSQVPRWLYDCYHIDLFFSKINLWIFFYVWIRRSTLRWYGYIQRVDEGRLLVKMFRSEVLTSHPSWVYVWW